MFDAQGHILAQRILNSLGLEVKVEYRKIFTEDLGLSQEELERLGAELHHPATHTASIGNHPADVFDHAIEIGYGPGVMDPEGRSAKQLAEVVLGKKFPFDRKVAVQHQMLVEGDLTEVQLRKIAGLFSNDIVQDFRILPYEECKNGIAPYMPSVKVPLPEPLRHYDLNQQFSFDDFFGAILSSSGNPDEMGKKLNEQSDKLRSLSNRVKDYFGNNEVSAKYLDGVSAGDFLNALNLLNISEGRVLALDLEEMAAIRGYYNRPDIIEARKKVGLSEKATDVELELFGQTWSEHCKHKIFNAVVTHTEGSLEETIAEGIFKTFIKSATLSIKDQKPDFIKSVLWDNSGVVDIDPNAIYYVCFKCETHNSPSFLEPYGGSITGIVGVYRDPLGTGRGSQLTFGVWGYCTGSIFYDGELRPPLHPDQLIEGIHRGVRDGGNKHGVPTAVGGTFFDNSYMGKCLVYVGAAGLVPKTLAGKPGYDKWVNPGDRVVVVGGRVGKDGIHGATASSKEYSQTTPKGHVQIGDPYTQKNVQEFMLDAMREGLINFSQDSGAGGTGSAAGEMAQYSNGAVIDLDKDLFKYEGLASWEILESESQERMFLAVSPQNMERIVKLAEKWNVEWRDIGEFNDSGYFHVKHKGETVAYLDMDFLHNGTPQKKLKSVWKTPEERGLKEPSLETLSEVNHPDLLFRLLARENIASKEFLQREYDTRVQGRTVIPAFIGEKSDVPTDAFVQKIQFDLPSAVACGIGLNPTFSKIDTYHMTMMAANEGLMRVVAVGANPDRTANNGNYCWPGVLPDESDESEYKMAQLVRAAKAQHDFAMATGVATISGKDSMKIQGNIQDVNGKRQRVYGLPAIQFATIGQVPDASKCVTSDFKKAGDIIYIVGPQTKDELGASELYEMLGEIGLNVPKVDPKESIGVCRALYNSIQNEYVESAKVCSKGGMGAALSLAAFGGGLGAHVELGLVPTDMQAKGIDTIDTRLLYSESASRFIVTVAPSNAEVFEKAMGKYAARIGFVAERDVELVSVAGNILLRENSQELKKAWQSTFKHKMYEQEKR